MTAETTNDWTADVTAAGVYTWPDGRRYEGEFKDGVSDGRGARSERKPPSFDHHPTTDLTTALTHFGPIF